PPITTVTEPPKECPTDRDLAVRRHGNTGHAHERQGEDDTYLEVWTAQAYSLKFDTLPTRYHRPRRFWYSSIHALVKSSAFSCSPGAPWIPRTRTCAITHPSVPSVDTETIGSATSRYSVNPGPRN